MPLDPSDHAYIDARLELARHRFESFGRSLVFRQSPLAPDALENLLCDRGWVRFDESIVMTMDLSQFDFSNEIDRVPMKNIGYWVDSFLHLSAEGEETKPGLVEVISSIQPASGLFVKSVEDNQVAAVRCVHDNDLAGIFDLVTGADYVRQGHARCLIGSALKWAQQSGARVAWLQVVAGNVAAYELYRRLGFRELYRYSYRKPPVGVS